MEIVDQFHKLEKECIGFDNYVNCEDKYYKETLEGLRRLVQRIQRESLFSPNEEISEIETDHLKLIMAPFYQADVLFRIMENRAEQVKMAHVFYIEYLRLLNHYGVLEKDQIKKWKRYMDNHKIDAMKDRKDATIEELKEIEEMRKELMQSKPNPYEDRESKIAEFKMKKSIQQQMDMLKDYKDEETKRDFYMAQIRQSVITCFEQLRLIEMEKDIHRHAAQLTPAQIEANKRASERPEPGSLPPLQLQTITKESLQKMPYLMRPQNEDLEDGGIVNEYRDPLQRVVVQ